MRSGAHNKARIRRFVSLAPGAHLRAIQRRLGISFSSTRYNVSKLASEGEVVCQQDGGFSRVFPAEMDEGERRMYSIVRNKARRQILGALLQEGSMSGKQIAESTGLLKSVVSQQSRYLLGSSLLRVNQTESGRTFEIVDRDSVSRLLARSDEVEAIKIVDQFIDLWDF